jgi:uncharacterized membrane protein (UPF0127 family)
VVALLVTGCSGSGSDAGATSDGTATTEVGLGEGFAAEQDGRRALVGFDEVAATITAADGTTCEVCLLSATSEAQRRRGLMEVTDADLGGFDGMLFRFPAEIDGGFWMRNTPLPLSIAYFDEAGSFVSATDMAPCRDSASCPTYDAAGPFRYALEVPEGELADLGATKGSTLRVDGTPCPGVETAP